LRTLFTYAFLLLLLADVRAQLLVSPNNSAGTLVQQIVGNNVVISNPVLNCNSQASGVFLSNGSNIGLSQGILLSTGRVIDAIGPNNSAGGSGLNAPGCFNSNPTFSDPNILSIEPQAKFDGCVLEFDVQPYCNTLQIKYVFGSEEYPEFVGKGFNDAFGFFIWGTNPGGGSYNGYNIARLPNGTPVAIDNINGGVNSNYYVNNAGGTTIQYDGFTVPLTASVNVVPCNTYHLKLAIADAGDCIYDSGVFLEYKGIGCPNNEVPAISTATTASQCDLNNGTATASISNYSGSLNYQWTPGSQTTATATGLSPGTYTCYVTFQNPCPYTKTVTVTVPHQFGFNTSVSINEIQCPQDMNGSATVTASGGNAPYAYSWNTVPVQNTSTATGLGLGTYICSVTDATGCTKKDTIIMSALTTLTLNPSSTDALCNNPTGTASANASGGNPAYTYTWSTSPVQTSATISGLLPGTYTVSVTDQAGCYVTAPVTVNNFVPTITLSDSLVHTTCGNPNGAIFLNGISGGTAPYSFSWSTTPAQGTQNIANLSAGVYTVSITDANNCPSVQSFTLINNNFIPTITTHKDDKCEQHKGWAKAIPIGGSPPFTYTWSDGQTTQQASGLGAGTYTVQIVDALGCTASATVSLINVNDIFTGTVVSYPGEPSANENFTITLSPTDVWLLNYAFISDGRITTDTINYFNYPDYGSYSITYYLMSRDGCRETVRYDFFVKDYMTLYIPNTFTPNGDGKNDVFYAYGTLLKNFEMQIFDRWGVLLFKTDDITQGWDGYYKGDLSQVDTYIYKVFATDLYNKQHTFVGHVNLLR